MLFQNSYETKNQRLRRLVEEGAADMEKWIRRLKLILLLLFISLLSYCQDSIKPLKIGDKVPDVIFEETNSFGKQLKSLSDLDNKYVIIDFWNKGCASCIAAFPDLMKLQDEFEDELQILLVTNNTPSQLEKLFKNSPILKNVDLPIVMSDTMLTKRIFPHKYVPFQVWLGKGRIVKAITPGYSSSNENVKSLLAGKNINVMMQSFFSNEQYAQVNKCRSLLTVLDRELEGNLVFYKQLYNGTNDVTMSDKVPFPAPYYSAFFHRISQFTPSPSSPVIIVDSAKKEIGCRLFNKPILSIIKSAYINVDIKVRIEGDVGFSSEPSDPDLSRLWFNENNYCYEAIIPAYTKERFRRQLQEDIKNCFGVVATIELREEECLVLRGAGNQLMFDASENISPVIEKLENEYVFTGCGFEALTTSFFIENKGESDPIFINETAIPKIKIINMRLNAQDLKYAASLAAELKKYGLTLSREKRKMKVLVVKKLKN